jgi:hypothetical protein
VLGAGLPVADNSEAMVEGNVLVRRQRQYNFFHLQACYQKSKSFIDRLVQNGLVMVTESDKAQAMFQHFDGIFGTSRDRTHALDLNLLVLATCDLQGIDRCFSEDEVWCVTSSMPMDKAPGPEGFTSLFY